jgi:hypothetical protein
MKKTTIKSRAIRMEAVDPDKKGDKKEAILILTYTISNKIDV